MLNFKAGMKTSRYLVLTILFLSLSVICPAQEYKTKVLIFSATKGFRHKSIPEGVKALQRLAVENKITADASEDPGVFTAENLKKYKGIIFLSTSGSFLNDDQKIEFQSYIRDGGGFMGIHAATTSFYEWEWYNKMIGAWFMNHPRIQPATLMVKDRTHLATRHLNDVWIHTDEWYNFKSINTDISVLITVDERSYTGGQNGDFHPVSWCHKFEGGRVFYTALGHAAETYSDKIFLEHLEGGLKWILRIKR